MKKLYVVVLFLSLTACLKQQDLAPKKTNSSSSTGDFNGCVSGSVTGSTSIQLNFEFPSDASKMTILRDGAQIHTTYSLSAGTSKVDADLREGTTYTYQCIATINGKEKVGAREITLTTDVVTPPTFSGVTAATTMSASSVRITWTIPTTGTKISKFKVYRILGSTMNFSTATSTDVSALTSSYTFTGLGDELPYTFSVRACATNDICDTNTVALTRTTSDGGAPTTIGITNVTNIAGVITLTAPWDDSKGAVARRKVYINNVGSALGNFNFTSAYKTENVTSPYTNPNTAITVTGLSESTSYWMIIRDEDAAGNSNNSTVVYAYATGDLTPPTFAGISNLTAGSPADTVLNAEFTAVTAQSMGTPNGASHYLIYTKSGGGDACTSGTLVNQVSANSYTNGQVVTLPVTGLTERTSYSVCVKARDEAGNISANTNYQTRSTLDITAPIFDGLQSVAYSNSNSRIELSWNPSPSADVKEYKVYVWKTLPATTLLYQHSTNSTGANFNTSSFAYADNDTLYFVVDACDTAAALPGGTQNCTAYPEPSKKTLVLPDVNPPVGFNGISGVTTPSAGTANVSWYAPSNWTGYAGFKVYHVTDTGAGTLSLLKSCPCTSSDCVTNPISSCSVTGLAKRKTYQFYVSAYDAANNETTSLLPATNAAYRVPMQTTDTAAPTFSSSLALNWVASPTAGVEITWSPGSDDQDISEPDSVNVGLGAQLRYQVYRKASSTFSSFSAGNTPPSDGTALLGTATNLNTYTDPSTGLTQGLTYYYTVCIRDASVNVYCDGVVQSIQAPDGTPPVLSNLISTKIVNATSWNMTWSMSDTGTSNPQLKVWLCRSTSGTPATNCTDNRLADGATSFADSEVSGSTLVYYRLRVVDLNNNEATLTAQSLNPAPTISGISPTQSSVYLDGGENITITGTGFLTTSQGFATDPVVLIGNALCTNTTVSTTSITCTTPAMSPGVYSVQITNADTQSVTQSSAYTYRDFCTISLALHGEGTWTQTVTGIGGGVQVGLGSSTQPYLICTGKQLYKMRDNLSGHYKLMRDIDLSLTSDFSDSVGGTQVWSSTVGTFTGGFYGNNYRILNANITAADRAILFQALSSGAIVRDITIENFTYAPSSSPNAYIGLLASTVTQTSTADILIKNVKIKNGTTNFVNGTTWVHYVGGLIGSVSDSGTTTGRTTTIEDCGNEVNLNNIQYVGGGIIGYYANSGGYNFIFQRNYNTGNISVLNQSHNTGSGGLIGQTAGWTGIGVYNTYIRDSYSTGNVSVVGGVWKYVGGAIGFLLSTTAYVDRIFTSGNVTASGNDVKRAGGVIGYSVYRSAVNTDLYSLANVDNGGGDYAGGIHSNHYDCQSPPCSITRAFAAGAITNSTYRIGTSGGGYSLSSSYWDFETTGTTTAHTGATQKATWQMQTQGTFTGWDFTAGSGVWRMPACAATSSCTTASWNKGYPALQGVTPFTCPSGFIYVPMSNATRSGITQQGSVYEADFCVAKYEMKDDGGGNAVSQASGVPWTNIARATAETKCQAMGTGYDLISNSQWQSIARNIEATATNWSGSAVGSGMLSVGLHNSIQSTGQAASSSDSEPCLYTNRNCQKRSDTSQWIYKRTLTLSNGNVIWDFAGNVSEHIKDTKASLSLTNLTTSSDFDFSHADFGTDDTTVNRKALGPYTSSYTATSQRTGLVTGGSGTGVIRGGAYNSSVTRSGIYATTLQFNGDNALQFGFRCVWQP